jgi:hypothetical protein
MSDRRKLVKQMQQNWTKENYACILKVWTFCVLAEVTSHKSISGKEACFLPNFITNMSSSIMSLVNSWTSFDLSVGVVEWTRGRDKPETY